MPHLSNAPAKHVSHHLHIQKLIELLTQGYEVQANPAKDES
jgi:hypothetical protein